MKLMIASDLHGSAYCCRKMLERFAIEKPARLLLLGDLLYHGPRNDLPQEYNPKEVIALLNENSQRLTAVRGNCDAEVDQMVLDFPIMAEYCIIDSGINEKNSPLIFATHGHIFGEQNPLNVSKGDILLCGHTHVPACKVHENFIYMNPGSVSIPKENSCRSYMTYENGLFTWKNLEDGKEYKTFSLN